MRALLLQLDGKLPNIALMRIAAHHRARGDEVELRNARTPAAVERELWDQPDVVYASAIFTATAPVVARVREVWPEALVGGTGAPGSPPLEGLGITTRAQDYTIYPRFRPSIGFTQRGCRLSCKFCVVPTKEGANVEEQTIADLWRGGDHARELLLLDNDFFGQPRWRERVEELRAGAFKVCLSQGINARLLDDEAAEALASLRYYDDSFRERRIYTAWDSLKDEERLFRGLDALVAHGVKPQQIMVYMLCGYWPGETQADREHRRAKLRAYGARPYPMPYVRTPELVAFQRWVVGAWDKSIPWADWLNAHGRPEVAAERHAIDARIGRLSIIDTEALDDPA